MVGRKTKHPAKGDIAWLSMAPQKGREQAGRHPVICLSPARYNKKSGLALFCPISSKKKGYPFEVEIATKSGITGVVLADQVKSLDWRERKFDFIEQANEEQLQAVISRVSTLIGS